MIRPDRTGLLEFMIVSLMLALALPAGMLTVSAEDTMEIAVGEPADIPPLTLPVSNPAYDRSMDVFERLEKEKDGGYIANFTEDIGENYYFTTKQGFDSIHLEGTSYEIGYNQAVLLKEKVERGMAAYAYLTEMRYDLTWPMCRVQCATYWPNIPQEYQQEMQGLADGCQAVGAKNPDGNVIDKWDIVAYNSIWDLWWRVSYIQGLIPGPFFDIEPIHHCSGFVCNSDYTTDGGFVMCQSLWMPYYLPPSHGVFADIVPQSGHRMLWELQAGMIWSGTEWYMNSEGLVVAETTLGDAPYQFLNVPAFVRVRKAVQYSSTIDEFASIMTTDTNGAYCGDYMACDAKTNEVSVVELGSHEYEVWRSDNGFQGSCNYPWDPEVRAEMEEVEGWEHSCYPRYYRLAQIGAKYKGGIDIGIAQRTLGDHWDTVEEAENKYKWTLCGHVENASGYPHGSLDGKVTNRSMVLNHECWARYGHSCGEDFDAAQHAIDCPDYAYDNLRDMIAMPWTTFGFLDPINVKVTNEKGEVVNGAQIVFENRADGYLAEGVTGADGLYSHPYFQTGSYNISVRMDDRFGFLQTDFSQSQTFEIVIRPRPESGGTGVLVPIVVVILILGLAGVAAGAIYFVKRRKG